ncbi:MAG: DNA/RNA helicase domain-containing protein, partial [Planctomycetota bacterium]|nr:DNA/RNA helicase domain-containing protein [Planctomycetota bacterium]
PIALTRDLDSAKKWLQEKARGTERIGLVASANALRLRASGIHVKSKIDPKHWFLNPKNDVRSSYVLEEVATEFDIQGLELDWVGVCWGGDFRFVGDTWAHHAFRGASWNTIRSLSNKKYLENAYRVLLTRARQGMVIFVPPGDTSDPTVDPQFYDSTYNFLLECGVSEIDCS